MSSGVQILTRTAPRRALFNAPAAAVLSAVVFFVCAALSGCEQRLERSPARRPANPAAGADGRPVLRITPRPRSLLAAPSTEAIRAIEVLDALDVSLPTSIDTLRASLDSPFVPVRRAAVRRLGDSGHPEAPRALLAAVGDQHPLVRALAEAAVADYPSARKPALFLRAIRGDDPKVARGAADGWPGLLGEKTEALAEALAERADPTAIALLAARGCPELPEPVRALGAKHEHPSVRASFALCGLWHARDRRGLPEGVPAGLASKDGWAAAVVAYGLIRVAARARSSDRALVLAALEKASHTLNARVSINVSGAQHAFGVEGALASFRAWLASDSADAALHALSMLRTLAEQTGGLQEASLVPGLQKAFSSGDGTTRMLAADVAGYVRNGELTSGLIKLLRTDGDSQVRFAAAYGLGQAGAKLAHAALVEYGIEDREPEVRDASFAALHHLVHDVALPPPSMVSTWLSSQPVSETFWARDHERWRRWYQLER